jgi:hypothetical protein
VFGGIHSARINVDVGVDFDGGDGKTAALQDGANGRSGDSFSNAGHDSTDDENIFSRLFLYLALFGLRGFCGHNNYWVNFLIRIPFFQACEKY